MTEPSPIVLPSEAAVADAIEDSRTHRNMAWVSLASIITVTLLLMFVVTPERLKAVEYIVTWFFTILGGIVLTEMGVSGWLSYLKK